MSKPIQWIIILLSFTLCMGCIATPGTEAFAGHFVKSGILRQNTTVAMHRSPEFKS